MSFTFPAGPGHNAVPGGIAADRLRNLVERIERLESDRREIADNVKDIYAEAKSAGFDTAVLRKLVARRRKERAELEEQDTLLDLYERALALL